MRKDISDIFEKYLESLNKLNDALESEPELVEEYATQAAYYYDKLLEELTKNDAN